MTNRRFVGLAVLVLVVAAVVFIVAVLASKAT
jgi:hypothetical protein